MAITNLELSRIAELEARVAVLEAQIAQLISGRVTANQQRETESDA